VINQAERWFTDADFVAWIETYFQAPNLEDEGTIEAMRDAYHAGARRVSAALVESDWKIKSAVPAISTSGGYACAHCRQPIEEKSVGPPINDVYWIHKHNHLVWCEDPAATPEEDNDGKV
jgi:hypothetical protein